MKNNTLNIETCNNLQGDIEKEMNSIEAQSRPLLEKIMSYYPLSLGDTPRKNLSSLIISLRRKVKIGFNDYPYFLSSTSSRFVSIGETIYKAIEEHQEKLDTCKDSIKKFVDAYKKIIQMEKKADGDAVLSGVAIDLETSFLEKIKKIEEHVKTLINEGEKLKEYCQSASNACAFYLNLLDNYINLPNDSTDARKAYPEIDFPSIIENVFSENKGCFEKKPIETSDLDLSIKQLEACFIEAANKVNEKIMVDGYKAQIAETFKLFSNLSPSDSKEKSVSENDTDTVKALSSSSS